MLPLGVLLCVRLKNSFFLCYCVTQNPPIEGAASHIQLGDSLVTRQPLTTQLLPSSPHSLVGSHWAVWWQETKWSRIPIAAADAQSRPVCSSPAPKPLEQCRKHRQYVLYRSQELNEKGCEKFLSFPKSRECGARRFDVVESMMEVCTSPRTLESSDYRMPLITFL